MKNWKTVIATLLLMMLTACSSSRVATAGNGITPSQSRVGYSA